MRLNCHCPELKQLCRVAIEIAEGLANNPSRGRLTVLHGRNGSGKTHFAQALVRWLTTVSIRLPLDHKENGAIGLADAWMFRWPEVLDSLKSGDWDITEDMKSPTLLVLDDIGAGHDPSKMGVDKLCQVLSRREHRWTIITTNFMPRDWPERLDQRVASRLLRNSVIVDLSRVPDYSTIGIS